MIGSITDRQKERTAPKCFLAWVPWCFYPRSDVSICCLLYVSHASTSDTSSTRRAWGDARAGGKYGPNTSLSLLTLQPGRIPAMHFNLLSCQYCPNDRIHQNSFSVYFLCTIKIYIYVQPSQIKWSHTLLSARHAAMVRMCPVVTYSMSSWKYAAECRSINPSSIATQLRPTVATLRWVA